MPSGGKDPLYLEIGKLGAELTVRERVPGVAVAVIRDVKIALNNNKIVVRHFKKWLEVKGFTNRKIGTFNPIDIDNFLGYKMNELKWGKVTYNTYHCDRCLKPLVRRPAQRPSFFRNSAIPALRQ